MPFPAFQGIIGASGGGTPLDYGSSLLAFWESENNVVDSSGEVTSWTDLSDEAYALTRTGNQEGPELEADTQNGFDGINFEETVQADPIDRKLSSDDSDLDNIFFGTGTKGLHFAARWDRTTDHNGFNLRSIIASKLYSFTNNNDGWRLEITTDGDLRFNHFFDDGSSWEIEAAGFYSVGDLVLGSVSYSGGNTSSSGTFRLYNNSTGQFVDTGTVTTSSGTDKSNDGAGEFVVGNMHTTTAFGDNSPFQGPIFGLWITKPFTRSLDDRYMQRWIP